MRSGVGIAVESCIFFVFVFGRRQETTDSKSHQRQSYLPRHAFGFAHVKKQEHRANNQRREQDRRMQRKVEQATRQPLAYDVVRTHSLYRAVQLQHCLRWCALRGFFGVAVAFVEVMRWRLLLLHTCRQTVARRYLRTATAEIGSF